MRKSLSFGCEHKIIQVLLSMCKAQRYAVTRQGTVKLASGSVCGPELVSGDNLLLHRIRNQMETGQQELLEREWFWPDYRLNSVRYPERAVH